MMDECSTAGKLLSTELLRIPRPAFGTGWSEVGAQSMSYDVTPCYALSGDHRTQLSGKLRSASTRCETRRMPTGACIVEFDRANSLDESRRVTYAISSGCRTSIENQASGFPAEGMQGIVTCYKIAGCGHA